MREITERPEAIQAGTVKLVGTNKASIISCVNELLCDSDQYQIMSRAHNPYGDGKSSGKIIERIKGFLNVT